MQRTSAARKRQVLCAAISFTFGPKRKKGEEMKGEFTAIIESAPEGGYWVICPEVPGANGQGETIEETKNNLREAIQLILEDRKADILRGLPEDAIQEKVLIG
jgi:predicted RNase H-like HicB family nuclease